MYRKQQAMAFNPSPSLTGALIGKQPIVTIQRCSDRPSAAAPLAPTLLIRAGWQLPAAGPQSARMRRGSTLFLDSPPCGHRGALGGAPKKKKKRALHASSSASDQRSSPARPAPSRPVCAALTRPPRPFRCVLVPAPLEAARRLCGIVWRGLRRRT